MINTTIKKQQDLQNQQQQQHLLMSQNQHAILMSSLKSDGQVENKLIKPFNVTNRDGQQQQQQHQQPQNQIKRDKLFNQTEANTFNIYQLSLRLDPFKKATCLLALNSIGILLISTTFFLLSLTNTSPIEEEQLQEQYFWPPSQATSYIIQLIANSIQLVVISFIIIKLRKRRKQQLLLSSPLSSRSQSSSYYNSSNNETNDLKNNSEHQKQNNYLKNLQITLLISSSCLITILSISDHQLIAIQATIIFIIYTLLAVDNQTAFLATFVANMIHLASLPFDIKYQYLKNQQRFQMQLQEQEREQEQFNLINKINYWPLILTIIVYNFFHAIGLYLNKESHDNCKESFKDIKSYVSAKIMMDIEDKKLTKLMESVIPKHLAGKMRDDILLPQNKGIFQKIYLESFDNVSILFADIVNFTKISSNCSAQSLVETLNELFGRFDKAADKNHCLRIKILGDCYYCVSGIPEIGRKHAIDSVEMGLDMIDILGELAQDNSGGLNMRVGIHSGRVLCGVLGKKKWQFDVHSNDVKLANHTEQSGIPGRVHITQDTLKALEGRYEVEDANGHLRDTYIAQRNISTYFVIPPSNRRPSINSFKSISSIANAASSNSTQTSNSIIVSTQPDQQQQQQQQQLLNKLQREQEQRNQHKSNINQLKDFPLSTTTTVKTTTTTTTVTTTPRASFATNQQQQQPKLRFKTATQRIINALHFIRTIDAPFANLDAPSSSSTTNIDRIMHDTIVSRCQIHHQDIHGVSLKFKDENLGQLYGHPSRLQMLKRLLIFISSLLLLMALVIQTTFDWNLQTIEFQIIPPNSTMTAAAAAVAATSTTTTTNNNHNNHNNHNNVNGNDSISDNGSSGGGSGGGGHSSGSGSSASSDSGGNGPNNNTSYDDKMQSKKSYVMMSEIFTLFLITILVYMHQNEHNARRDFLWRQIAIQDKDRMALMRDCNRFIFFNLLPPHVASYFLEQRGTRPNMDQDLYHKSYDRIGVVFATISNFSDFYCEVQVNNHGMECLRLLNEIICDFDSILDDERFKAVDKIKTIGSTYMAAIGLFPDYELPRASIESISDTVSDTNIINNKSNDVSEENSSLTNSAKAKSHDDINFATRREVAKYLQILVRFVIEMRGKLEDINENSYNCFKLRVGINLGPVTAGVIGASKPQYDIWGNTVNVASRMETTAEPNKIQITEEVYQILNEFNDDQGFKFTCRGSINVKGKGYMTTYYLDY